MEHFAYNDLSIAYERRGSGPPMLFLHNGGTSSRIWRPQVESFSDRFDTVAVDLPGFGESTLGARPLTLAAYAEAVTALVEHLDLAATVIVGNCMGSNIATVIAENDPTLVRALVLVNPLTEATFGAGWLGPLHKLNRLAPPVARLTRRVSRHIRVPRVVAPLVVGFQVGAAGRERRVNHDPELIACNLRAQQLPALIDVLEDMGAYGGLDRGRQLAGIPILTMWGASNRVLSERVGRTLNQTLAPEANVVLERCGHLPMLERPAEVTAAIGEFLSGLPPAGPAETSTSASAIGTGTAAVTS